MILKKVIKRSLPPFVVNFLKKYKKKYELYTAYYFDFRRFCKHSVTFKIDDKDKLEAMIIKYYHMIEKGLTMPKPRLGFGKDVIIVLSNDCLLFLYKYKVLSTQVVHAIAVLKEYKKLHEDHGVELGEAVNTKLAELFKSINQFSIECSSQLKFTKDEYFNYTTAPFDMFSNSRKSVRNYISEPIPKEKIISALKLAMNTPSACNRQSTRLHVFTDKEKITKILSLQNGNRGFGYLSSTLIVISADLSCFGDAMERNQAFIDGGMFAMNLLYCLHYQDIACCTLNCSNPPYKDRQLQKVCGISESNVFIAMIACGFTPNEFMVANSSRYDFNDVCKVD